MDDLKTLLELVQGGGPLVTIVAVWVAFKAGQQAKLAVASLTEAVTALKEIRDLAKQSAPKIDQIIESVERVEKDLAENGAKFDKLIPRVA